MKTLNRYERNITCRTGSFYRSETISEMPAFIAASDICLLPAYPWEKTMQDIVPIKMYEYMAMKKPVIATRLPGVMKEFGEDNGVVYVE